MDSQSLLERYEEKYGVIKTLDDYKKSKSSGVYRKFLKALAGSNNLLESFNNWAENTFEEQIIKQSFTAEDGTKIEFKNPKLHKPVIMINGKEETLYPQYCRDNNYPYTGRVSLECVTTKKSGEKISTKFDLGQIPIMIGSKMCNLYGKTDEELVALGECVTDPFGYFHIRTERSVITQDKKRMLVPVVYFDKKNTGKLVCDYTSCKKDRNGSKILKLQMGKKWGTMKVNDNYEKQVQAGVYKKYSDFCRF